jgi:hypothetical protein
MGSDMTPPVWKTYPFHPLHQNPPAEAQSQPGDAHKIFQNEHNFLGMEVQRHAKRDEKRTF